MKKALFALSLLVVAPMIKASEKNSRLEQQEAVLQAKADDAASTVQETSVVEETVVAPVVEEVTAPVVAEEVTAPAKNIFAKGFEKAANGMASVKNGTVNGVVFVKDGVFYAYDKVTGKIEAFTPNMILNVRDSVRSTIANYPLTAIALTAFVAVKASEFFAASSEDEDEDDSF